MMRVLFLLGVLVVAPTASASQDVERMDGVHVIYLDPALKTYGAVSRGNLVYNRPCIVSLPPKPLIDEIIGLLERASYGPFDDALVRIKIDGVTEGPIYIDAEGGAFLDGKGVSKKLSGRAFGRLKKLFDPLREGAGCHSMGRWPYT